MTSSSKPGDARIRVDAVDGESTARIIIRGEADAANADNLKDALDSIVLDGARTVQLDVSDLTFADVAALRQLTAFAHHMRQDRRAVKTCGAQPTLHRMVLMLDVQGELGLP